MLKVEHNNIKLHRVCVCVSLCVKNNSVLHGPVNFNKFNFQARCTYLGCCNFAKYNLLFHNFQRATCKIFHHTTRDPPQVRTCARTKRRSKVVNPNRRYRFPPSYGWWWGEWTYLFYIKNFIIFFCCSCCWCCCYICAHSNVCVCLSTTVARNVRQRKVARCCRVCRNAIRCDLDFSIAFIIILMNFHVQ